MSEAEGVAKRAEEELAVAKERLLLQEDELQNRAGVSVCSAPNRSLGFQNSLRSFLLQSVMILSFIELSLILF